MLCYLISFLETKINSNFGFEISLKSYVSKTKKYNVFCNFSKMVKSKCLKYLSILDMKFKYGLKHVIRIKINNIGHHKYIKWNINIDLRSLKNDRFTYSQNVRAKT